MEITLNHTIISSYDKIASAKFYEEIFCFKYLKTWGRFAVVKVNTTLTFDFITKKKFPISHYAFKVSNKDFDTIFDKLKKNKISYGSLPNSLDDGMINNLDGGRGVYFKDLNGHILEILTKDYNLDRDPIIPE